MFDASTRRFHGSVLVAFVLSVCAPALMAQETPVAEPSAEPAPAESGELEGTPASAPAAAEAPETVATIPVDSGEPEAAPRPRYPYTFAAVRVVHVETDDIAMDGLGIEGSYLLSDNAYGVVAITSGERDDSASTEVSAFEIGAGYRQDLPWDLDLNVGIRVLQQKLKAAADRETEQGYRVDAGVRATLLPRLEGNAALRYEEIGHGGHAFLAGSALYELLPRLSLGAEAIVGNSSTTYSVVGRWAF